jgi:hypothetical protein
MAGVFILALTTLTASALLPLTALLRTNSGDYSRAAAMIQRKMEQVRNLDVSRVTGSGLRTARVIDETNTATGANTYSFTAVDLVGSAFNQGVGIVQLTDPGTDLVRVDVTVMWRGPRGKAERIDATTFVSSREPWREP